MNAEVRYHLLRPDQIVTRRQACPVVYIPIGNLEWHGVHNPLGADTLQAEGLAMLCAAKGGGLVFPALYYGESRAEHLVEVSFPDREQIAAGMGLPAGNVSPSRQPFSPTEQAINYHKLLLHILAEAESLGFQVGVLVAGHYPLIDHAYGAALQFNQREHAAGHGLLAWACADYLLVGDRYEHAGDHGSGWETSHLLALHAELVELSLLPPRGEQPVGIVGTIDARDSSAAFGRETLEAAAEIAVREVRHRLQHPEVYRAPGRSLCEGLWRKA